MNTQTKTTFIYSEVAQKAIEMGQRKHWKFRVVGHGPVPDRPFYRGAWWFEPVKELPKGKDRIDALRASGVDFKGFVVAHEVVLVETKEQPVKTPQKKIDFKNTTPDILPDIGKAIGTLAMGLLWFTSFVFQAILIDPAYIVVLEDDSWLEVLTCYE